MPYYECPVCGGGYVIDPAPTKPICDRDGATLKKASEASYESGASSDDAEMAPVKREHRKKSRSK